MFRALFAALTGGPRRGQDLFDFALAEAGRPEWFVGGEVPDTVNGRFAVLATIIALITVRLEGEGPESEQASVALAERLVETLDVEIREMGVGVNPKLTLQPGTDVLPYYGYGAGVVRISIGDNEEIGGAVRGGGFSRWFFLTDATVDMYGTPLIKDGKLILD